MKFIQIIGTKYQIYDFPLLGIDKNALLAEKTFKSTDEALGHYGDFLNR